jgi:hypothetical protein
MTTLEPGQAIGEKYWLTKHITADPMAGRITTGAIHAPLTALD